MKRSEKLRAVQEAISLCLEDVTYYKAELKLEKRRLKKLQRKEIKLQQMD